MDIANDPPLHVIDASALIPTLTHDIALVDADVVGVVINGGSSPPPPSPRTNDDDLSISQVVSPIPTLTSASNLPLSQPQPLQVVFGPSSAIPADSLCPSPTSGLSIPHLLLLRSIIQSRCEHMSGVSTFVYRYTSFAFIK